MDVGKLANEAGLYGPPPNGAYPMLGAPLSARIERFANLVLEEAAKVLERQSDRRAATSVRDLKQKE